MPNNPRCCPLGTPYRKRRVAELSKIRSLNRAVKKCLKRVLWWCITVIFIFYPKPFSEIFRHLWFNETKLHQPVIDTCALMTSSCSRSSRYLLILWQKSKVSSLSNKFQKVKWVLLGSKMLYFFILYTFYTVILSLFQLWSFSSSNSSRDNLCLSQWRNIFVTWSVISLDVQSSKEIFFLSNTKVKTALMFMTADMWWASVCLTNLNRAR